MFDLCTVLAQRAERQAAVRARAAAIEARKRHQAEHRILQLPDARGEPPREAN